MGARSGGSGVRGMMWSMQGNSKQAHSNWSSAIQSTAGKLAAGTHKGPWRPGDKPRKLTGAAKKNTIGTLKQLMAMHPTASFTKALKSGKVVGINPKDLK